MSRNLIITALVLAAFGVLAAPLLVSAEDGDLPLPQLPAGSPANPIDLDLPTPTEKKSGSVLSGGLAALASSVASPTGFAPGAGQSSGATVVVAIRIDGHSTGVAEQIAALGGRVANIGPDFIEAEIAVDRLTTVAALDGVVRVDLVSRPVATVVTQGTTVHRSDLWNTHGLTGSGVKVGVIDVSFDGYASLMGSELPGTVIARCYTAVGVFTSNVADCENGDVHGTAVAETIHDIAPDAVIYVSDPSTPGDLQTVVDWMISQGVDVINHSVGWPWDGPGDGTSPFSDSPLASVDAAVAAGIIWVNAAGNAARHTWFAGYKDSDSDGWIEFTTGDLEGNAVVLTAFNSYIFQLRWDDDWGAATRDFDLYIYDSTGTIVRASSLDPQSGGPGHYPGEGVLFVPPTSGIYHLAIFHFAGGAPDWIQLNAFLDPDLLINTADNNGGSISNPAESANPGLLTVGAADWRTTATIEDFSSRGPTPDGRVKPDIVGADRGDTASYGPLNFPGTSQASPHVAGLAALVLERFPAFTPGQTADYLKTSAVPRGSPDSNNVWGHGFARLADLSPLSPLNVSATPGDGQATISWDVPTSDGGSSITQYAVASSPGAIAVNVSGAASQAVVTGLTNGVGYTFTVTASNAEGSGIASGPSPLVVPVGLPSAPLNVSATPGNGQATVTWQPPSDDGGAPVQQYTVFSSPGGIEVTVNATVTEAVVTGLTSGVSYTFTVTASNAEGTGPASGPSSVVTPTGPPSAPLNVSATPGNGQATVSWDVPTSDGGSSITGYLVTVSPGGQSVPVDGSSVLALVTGLTNGQAYTFTVSAVNALGTGAASAPAHPATPTGPPGAPVNVQATAFNHAVALTWDAPPSDGGLAITQYTVQVLEGEVTSVTVVATGASILVAQNSVSYRFTVTAHNAAGAGPGSASSNGVIPLPNLPILVPSASGWALIVLAAGMAFAAVMFRRRQSTATK
jgi:hypothetical protein